MTELIHFNQNEFIEGDDLQERFGLRGRDMLHLAQLKSPIAPGFLIESKLVQNGLKEKLTRELLQDAVKKIEVIAGKSFGSPEQPMLFKVVVSPSIQIGTISSVHTVGINDEIAQALSTICGEDFAYQEYRFFMEAMSSRFLGKSRQEFQALSAEHPNASNKEVCQLYREKIVPDFPQDSYAQLQLVLIALAQAYLSDEMNEDIEAGLMVQMMVYGNFGENSYNGTFYSRNLVTGEPRLTGHFGHNEFDTHPSQGTDINDIKSEFFEQLKTVSTRLEEKFLDIRNIKFVIEEERFWLIEQSSADSKSTQAEVRTLLDLHKKGLVDTGKLITSVPPGQLQDLLHPIIDHNTTQSMPKIVGGLVGSPGAALGRIAFSAKALLEEYRRCSLQSINSDLILCMPHTDAEDVEAIELGKACIASVGGYASHAPVVSRSLRKPCILNEKIQFFDGYCEVDGIRINEFDTISLEGPTYTDPTIWVGEATLISPDTAQNGLEEFISVVKEVSGELQVLGIANKAEDIAIALRLGAEGIGRFPCDALLRRPQTLAHFREALLLNDAEQRKAALMQVTRSMEVDVLDVFKLVEGRKVVFQLMNMPLHDYMPHSEEEENQVFAQLHQKHPELSIEQLKDKASQLRNVNPTMGLRGCRVGISYPDLYACQVAAILSGAAAYGENGKNPVDFDLLVPAVIGDAEMRFIRHGRNIESTTIDGIHSVQQRMAAANGDISALSYQVGAGIELPAAALMAGHLSKQSDFFSIDTNVLTQTTNGMFLGDINSFLPSYTQYDIMKDNPFQILSSPVKELIGTAVHYGKLTRPDIRIGICGENASEPGNVDFALMANLNFIACSPLGVPIARLTVAQKKLKNRAA